MSIQFGIFFLLACAILRCTQSQPTDQTTSITTPSGKCQSNDDCPDYQCCYNPKSAYYIASKRFMLPDSELYTGSRCENYTKPGGSCSNYGLIAGCRCMPGYYCGWAKIPTGTGILGRKRFVAPPTKPGYYHACVSN